jgi:two-component system nitrate/nitrite response regulator NarL
MVLDLRLAKTDGLSVLRMVRNEGYETPVVILTMSDSEDDMAAALRAGVRGYLLKDMEPDEVIDAIGRAARGEMVVASAMTLKLAMILQSGPKVSVMGDLVATLTEREREVLNHVARGCSNKVIAKALDISHNTVKLHIMDKLNLHSRVEAAVFAFEYGSSPEGVKSAIGIGQKIKH